MRLRILYFAGLRESLQKSTESLDVPAAVTTVGQLRDWMRSRGEPFATSMALGRAVRVAVAQQMAADDVVLHEGAEVAFFPPVTGG